MVEVAVFLEPQNGATYDDQLAVAQAAEQTGFDAFFRSDHLAAVFGDGLPGPTESWVTLAALARETKTIRLGTLVTASTFRHPGLLAIQVAQVDAMSGGRVELGIGAAWYELEHEAYGIPFPPMTERLKRLGEQLDVITGLWCTAEGETFSFAGDYFTVVESTGRPHPVQHPHPPIIVGGFGPRRTPMLAARFASEFNMPFSDIETTRAQYGRVRAACEEQGRDPDTLRYSHALTVFCGESRDEATARAAKVGQDPDQVRSTGGVVGTVEDVAERLAEYRELGATRHYLQLLDNHDVAHVELLGAGLTLLREGS